MSVKKTVAIACAVMLALASTAAPSVAQESDSEFIDVVDNVDWCDSIMYYTQLRYSMDYCGDCDDSMNESDASAQTERLIPYCQDFLSLEWSDAIAGEAKGQLPITYSLLNALEDYEGDVSNAFPCLKETGSLSLECLE